MGPNKKANSRGERCSGCEQYETSEVTPQEAGHALAEKRVRSKDLQGRASSPNNERTPGAGRGQAKLQGPSREKEIGVSVTKIASSLGQSSPARRSLEEGPQRSYDQMVLAGMTMSRATRWDQRGGRDQAHWGAQAEFQRQINKYHRLLYRELDPGEGFEVRIPKKAVLPSPELMDPEVRLKQGRIPAAEVCAGLVSTWSLAGRDSGLLEAALAAEVDPTARAEYNRKFPDAWVTDDCRCLKAADYTNHYIQCVQASVPCTPWTRGGARKGKGAAEGDLMEQMAPEWGKAYGGLGVPIVVIECTLGFESAAGGHPGGLRGYVQDLLPGYWVQAGITEADRVRSPLDGEQAGFTKSQWWITALAKAYFSRGLMIQTPPDSEATGVAADFMDTDQSRSQGYWVMPEEDVALCRPVERYRGRSYRVMEVADKPTTHQGIGGFPTKISDPALGNAPTITTGSRGGWFLDYVGGKWCVRQLSLVELARGSRIRNGGINAKFLALDSGHGTRALAMCIPQNVADFSLISVLRAYTEEDREGLTPEDRFLRATRPEQGRNWYVSTTKQAAPELLGAAAEETGGADLGIREGIQEALQDCVTIVVQEEFKERMRVGLCPLVVDTVVDRWRASRVSGSRTDLRDQDDKWPHGRISREALPSFRRERRAYQVFRPLAGTPELIEKTRERLLFSATKTSVGTHVQVLVSHGPDGRWACPAAHQEGDLLGPAWVTRGPDAWREADDMQEVAVGRWQAREMEGPWASVRSSAVLVEDPGEFHDRRWDDDVDLNGHGSRDPLGLRDHQMVWIPLEQLAGIDPDEWVEREQGGRMRWLAYEAAAWLGVKRCTPVVAVQRAALYGIRGQVLPPEHLQGAARLDQIVGRVMGQHSLPGNRQSGSIKPVQVEFIDYLGARVKLPQLAQEPGVEMRHHITYDPLWCLENQMLIGQGSARASEEMIALHVTNRGGSRRVIPHGQIICLVDGVDRLTTEESFCHLAPGQVEWLRSNGALPEQLSFSSDLRGDWRGKDVLLDESLDYGDLEAHQGLCYRFGHSGARRMVMVQTVSDPAVLEPWRTAGYTVRRMIPEGQPVRVREHRMAPQGGGQSWASRPCQGKAMWAIWGDAREARTSCQHLPTLNVMAALVDGATAVADRRTELIAKRKALTGDHVHQFPDDDPRAELVDQMFEPHMPLFDPDNLGRAEGVECEIDTGDAPPVLNQPYRLSPHERDIIREEVAKMLKLGVIQPSKSPWGSLPVLARKADGTTRFCVDYRGVNRVTKSDAMPIPRIDDTLAALQGAAFFTTMDAMSGFWQVPMKESHIEKTAFLTIDGSFEYTRMPFGLRNAPACFQRLMNGILTGLAWQSCLVYIDDCTVFSKTFEDHLRDVNEVLVRFRRAGLTLKMSKCRFFVSEMEFLGHVVSGEGIRPSPSKVEAIQGIKLPTNISELRGFLGMTGWFRKFIPNYARVALPLTQLTKKEHVKKVMEGMKSEACRTAFAALKAALVGDDVLLVHPDFSKKFRVDLDASDRQIGGVLLQYDDDKEAWRPIEYLSRKYTKELKDKEFAPTHMEAQALQACVDRWRPYLIDKCFDLVTDHTALKSLPTRKMDQNTLTRHQVLMQPFNYTIVYRPGSIHHVPDGLSRLPREESPATDLPYQDYGDNIPHLEASRRLADDPEEKAASGLTGEQSPEPPTPATRVAPPPPKAIVLCVATCPYAIETRGRRRERARQEETDPLPESGEGGLEGEESTGGPAPEGVQAHGATSEEELKEMEILNSLPEDAFDNVELTAAQKVLLHSLDFTSWEDLRITLGLGSSVLGDLFTVVRGNQRPRARRGRPKSDAPAAVLEERVAGDYEGDLEVEQLNLLTTEQPGEVRKLGLSPGVTRLLLHRDFDDWADVQETTGCSAEEVSTLRLWVRLYLMGDEDGELKDPEGLSEAAAAEDHPAKTEMLLRYGSPDEPGLQLPSNAELVELQRTSAEMEDLREYCLSGGKAGQTNLRPQDVARVRVDEGTGLLVREVKERVGYSRKARERGQDREGDLKAMGDREPRGLRYQRIIPPGQIRRVLLYYFHGHEVHQHPGLERMLELMGRSVWWKEMREDAKAHVEACPCLKDGRYPRGAPSVMLKVPIRQINGTLSRPHERLCLDHKGLPDTVDGYTAVLIMVDGFSGYVQLAAQKTQTAGETAQTILDRWIQPFCVPEGIHADGGKAFTGELVIAVNRCLRVRDTRIVPGNPRGNALAEATVGQVKRALTNLVSQFPRAWPAYLPFVCTAFNESISLRMGVAPVTVHLGRYPQGLTEMELPLTPESGTEGGLRELTVPQAARKWVARIQTVLTNVCRGILEDRHEEWNRVKGARTEIAVHEALTKGDLVYFWCERIRSRLQAEQQLTNPWKGPYPVVKVCREGRVIVIRIEGREQLCHPRHLRRYLTPVAGCYPTEGPGHRWGRPVEVLSHRKHKGDDEYLTRYISHTVERQEWSTWQLLSPDLVQTFLRGLRESERQHLRPLTRGVRAYVWWPSLRKSRGAVVAERKHNLLQVQYDNGQWGVAYVNVDGRIVNAEESETGRHPNHSKPRGLTSARGEEPDAAESTSRPRKTKGYQLVRPVEEQTEELTTTALDD